MSLAASFYRAKRAKRCPRILSYQRREQLTGLRSMTAPLKSKDVTSGAWVFALTIFLSAFLLFELQLILSKHILPWFGGSAAVWTTCMLVYQTLLLAGTLSRPQTNLHVRPRFCCQRRYASGRRTIAA